MFCWPMLHHFLHHFAPLVVMPFRETAAVARRRHDSATGEDLQPESPSSFGGLTRCISHAQETGHPARQADQIDDCYT